VLANFMIQGLGGGLGMGERPYSDQGVGQVVRSGTGRRSDQMSGRRLDDPTVHKDPVAISMWTSCR